MTQEKKKSEEKQKFESLKKTAEAHKTLSEEEAEKKAEKTKEITEKLIYEEPKKERKKRVVKKEKTSEKVEVKFAEFLDGDFCKVSHINLSNVVLQYIQPLAKQATWYEQLQKSGPGVHNITFLVNDIEKTVENFKNNGVSDQIFFPLEWENFVGKEDFNPNSRIVHIFNTMEKLGFHLELFERPSINSTDYLFTEVREWWDKNT